MEESIWEILNKINIQETNITVLGVQQGQMMAQLQHVEQNSAAQSNHQEGSEHISGVQNKNLYFCYQAFKGWFPSFL